MLTILDKDGKVKFVWLDEATEPISPTKIEDKKIKKEDVRKE
jgi:hypothetical protein